MVPQGSSLINTDHFVNMIDAIDATETCEALQGVVDKAFASLNAVKVGLEAELAKLMPVISLTSPPGANLGAIVSWISNFINFTLIPMVKPTITFVAQLNATLVEIAKVEAAISAAAARLTSCTISVPSMSDVLKP